MSETINETSMFDRIGGVVAVDRLVEAFYGYMDSCPKRRPSAPCMTPILARSRLVLKRYLSEWTGGPKLYSPEKGHPRLRQRHMGFPIGDAERDAWMACMTLALDECVEDQAARAELEGNLRKLADWMRNKA